jgi:hypothetical protein
MEHDFALSVAFFELAVCIYTHGGDRFITICPQIEFTFVFPSQRQRRFIVMEKCYPDATMPFPTAYGSGPCQNVAHSGILHRPAPSITGHPRSDNIRAGPYLSGTLESSRKERCDRATRGKNALRSGRGDHFLQARDRPWSLTGRGPFRIVSVLICGNPRTVFCSPSPSGPDPWRRGLPEDILNNDHHYCL